MHFSNFIFFRLFNEKVIYHRLPPYLEYGNSYLWIIFLTSYVHNQGYLTCVVMVTYVLDRLDKLYLCNVTINKIPFLGFQTTYKVWRCSNCSCMSLDEAISTSCIRKQSSTIAAFTVSSVAISIQMHEILSG